VVAQGGFMVVWFVVLTGATDHPWKWFFKFSTSDRSIPETLAGRVLQRIVRAAVRCALTSTGHRITHIIGEAG